MNERQLLAFQLTSRPTPCRETQGGAYTDGQDDLRAVAYHDFVNPLRAWIAAARRPDSWNRLDSVRQLQQQESRSVRSSTAESGLFRKISEFHAALGCSSWQHRQVFHNGTSFPLTTMPSLDGECVRNARQIVRSRDALDGTSNMVKSWLRSRWHRGRAVCLPLAQ